MTFEEILAQKRVWVLKIVRKGTARALAAIALTIEMAHRLCGIIPANQQSVRR
jgi:hypothetical protein